MFNIRLVVFVLKADKVLVGGDEGLLTELRLQIYAERLDSIAHAVRGLDAGEVLQKFGGHPHLDRLLAQRILLIAVGA